jgi:hypothetical protein
MSVNIRFGQFPSETNIGQKIIQSSHNFSFTDLSSEEASSPPKYWYRYKYRTYVNT